MKIVVDSNIVFSCLLKSDSVARDFIFEERFQLFAPNFLATEIFKHKEKIVKQSLLTSEELLECLSIVFEKITFYSVDIISKENWIVALDLCNGIDLKDVPFVALSLELKANFHSYDKKLLNHLRRKNFIYLYK